MGKILNRRIIRRKEDIRQLAHGQTSIIFGKNLLPTGRSRAKQQSERGWTRSAVPANRQESASSVQLAKTNVVVTRRVAVEWPTNGPGI